MIFVTPHLTQRKTPWSGRCQEGVTTADGLRGIAETRRTVTAELVAAFEHDIENYARV